MLTSFTGSFQAGRRKSVSDVVLSGLQLYLDAGNTASYPGSGTTWTDISGNGNNATLVNGAYYSGGSMIFDGADDYADFYAANLSNVATVEMWARIGAAYSGKMFFGWNFYDVWCANGALGYNTATSDAYGISAAQVSNLGLVGNWKHYVFEMRSDVSYVNNKIYINGSQQTLSQIQGSESASNRNFNSGLGRIAVWIGNNNFNMPMNCSIFKVYNRSLTQAEVTQNFNVFRSRYGI